MGKLKPYLLDRAHPRWRGEHIAKSTPSVAARGSSPLARGTPARQPKAEPMAGLIPAGAGNTDPDGTRWVDEPAHPRWRGEHSMSCVGISARGGSSPLARGTHTTLHTDGWKTRLIPAGAGNTWLVFMRRGARQAHPRWRGEHQRGAVYRRTPAGSSPLARGTRDQAGRHR